MKGFSGTWNIVVTATIGIVVLAVIVFLILTKTGDFDDGAKSCEDKGGVCSRTCGENYMILSIGCSEEAPKCCVPRSGSELDIINDVRSLS